MPEPRPLPAAPSASPVPPQGAELGPGRRRAAGGAGAGRIGRLRTRWTSFWHREGVLPWLGVLGAVTIWTVLVGFVCTLRFEDFRTFAYDLGNYNQIFWTTAEDHQLFYSSAGSPHGVSGVVVLGHFSPIFFLLVPIYAIAPGPPALLYMQAAALAAGALPTFGLARHLFRSDRWGLYMAGVYLATPLTFWPAWYDFHPEVFFVAPVLAAFYFLEIRRTVPFLLSLALGLSAIETLAPFLLAFVVLAILPSFWYRLRHRPPLPNERALLAALVLCAGYLAFSYEVSVHASAAAITFGSTYDFWPQIMAYTPYQVYPQALLHPGNALSALSYDPNQKLLYVVLVFGALGFLSLLGPLRFLVPGLLWLGLAVLSANQEFIYVGDEYSCYVLPFFVAAAVFAVARIRTWALARPVRVPEAAPASPRRRFRSLARSGPSMAAGAIVLLGLMATNAVASPLNPSGVDFYYATPPGLPSFTSHDAWEMKLIGMIPKNAGVLTDATGFPFLSDRPNAYDVPWQTTLVKGLTFIELLDSDLNRSNYILLDWRTQFLSAALVVQDANLTSFGLLAAADEIYLWERNYTGPPVLFVPYEYAVPGSGTTLGDAEADPTNASALGPSLYHPPGLANGTLLWNGLGLTSLAPGNYTLQAWVAVRSNAPGPAAMLTVTDAAFHIISQLRSNYSGVVKYNYMLGPPAPARLLGSDLVTTIGAEGGYVEGNVTFQIDWTSFGYLNSLGWALSAGASVRLYALTLDQVSP